MYRQYNPRVLAKEHLLLQAMLLDRLSASTSNVPVTAHSTGIRYSFLAILFVRLNAGWNFLYNLDVWFFFGAPTEPLEGNII